MAKHSKCVIGVYDNDMQYREFHKKHSNVDRDIIMHKLPKDGAVKASWTNAIFKGIKQVVQENLHTFITVSKPSVY